MNIAYLCSDFDIPIHGSMSASIHIRELSQALQDLGHEVLILSPRAGAAPPVGLTALLHEHRLARAEQVIYHLLREDPSVGERAAKELRGVLYSADLRRNAAPLLAAFAPDLIYERHALFATAGAELARRLGVPYVVEVDALIASEQIAHRGLVFGHTARTLERMTLLAADRVVATSAALEPWLIELGVAPERIAVLPDAITIARFAELGSAWTRPMVGASASSAR